MADQNHMTGSGGSGGQGNAPDRGNQDPNVPNDTGSGEQESGAGYGNNAGVQGETLKDTEASEQDAS